MDETQTPDPQATQDAPAAGSSPEPLTLTGSATDFDDDPPPTLGRIVHFVNGFDEHEAAIVTHVFEPSDTVNLGVFTKRGMYESPTSIAHDESGARFTWHWPETV